MADQPGSDLGSGVYVVYFDPEDTVALKDLEFPIPNDQADEWDRRERRYALAVERQEAGPSIIAGGGVLVFGGEAPSEEGDIGLSTALSKVSQVKAPSLSSISVPGVFGRIVPSWTLRTGFPVSELDIDLEKRLYGEGLFELSMTELEAFRPVFAQAGEEEWLDEKLGTVSEPDGSETEGEDEEPPAEQSLPSVWLCQYTYQVRHEDWVTEAAPGSQIPWNIADADISTMRAGDPVIYWRNRDRRAGGDDGGIVGTGMIVSPDLREGPDGSPQVLTQVVEFDDTNPLRQPIVTLASDLKPPVARIPFVKVRPTIAARISELLGHHDRRQLFGEDGPKPESTPSIPFDTDGKVTMRRDDPVLDHDALGRAPLALSLAWTLHEIWCTEQGLAPYPERRPRDDAPGFVAHIDAPWGGGKTSFANLVAGVLNPDVGKEETGGEAPAFLKALYPGRKDLSGLFISEAHELGKLKSEDGSDRWHIRARRPWIVVIYNAWLHQHVDPPWWSFYQAIRRGCFKAVREEGLPTVCQNDDGTYKTRRENGLVRLGRWFALWAREFGWRISSGKVVTQFVVVAASILAVFLLRRFGVMVEKDGEAVFSAATDIGFVIAVLTGAGAFLMATFTVFADALAPGRSGIAEWASLGSIDPLTRFRKHFATMLEHVGRPVLVVVDDIDRCDPKFIVGMTRGLQTILKSPRVVYLLLGDRGWIEKAFEVCHAEMSEIDVGPEHTFGGRFVEKAIQLSYVLPIMGAQKEDYVREVLIGRRPDNDGSMADAMPSGDEEGDDDTRPKTISAQARQSLREKISKATTAEEIDELGAAAMKTNSPEGRAYQRAVREEVILQRTAQKDVIERQIRHRLQPLARYLPDNPRHVKRIINAISMYQNSILLTEDFGDAEFGGEQWRRLVIGVVLMIGFPKSWSILAGDPDLAQNLIDDDEPKAKGTDTARLDAFQRLRSNPDFLGLLAGTKLLDRDGQKTVDTIITPDVVKWLKATIPVTG